MSRLSTTVLAVAFCAAAIAAIPVGAPAAEAVSSAYDPPVGSHWTILSELREEKTQDGKSTDTIAANRKEELTIVEKANTGYRVALVLRSFDMHGNEAETIAMTALLGALRDVIIKAVVDQGGKPVRIENLDEVAAAHRSGFERMLAGFSDKPQLAAKLRELLGPIFDKTASDPAEAAQWYLETVALLSTAQNSGLAVGQERRSSKAAQNPLGGEPIKMNSILRLVEADTATGKAKLVLTEAFDQASLKESSLAIAKKMLGSADAATLEKVMSQMAMSNDDRTEFVVEGGMTRSVSADTTLSVTAMGHALSKHQHNQVTVTAIP